MCDLTGTYEYRDQWEDYFTYVNTSVLQKLQFEDDLYIAYGSHYKLPVEDIKFWYEDAEVYFVTSLYPDGYIAHKYSDHVLTEDDVDYFLDKEIDEGMLFENLGYWFRA